MRIAIIGGAGKMGQWFARFLLKEGNEVVITGRNQRKLLEARQQLGVEVATNIEAAKKADVILLSVSIDSFEKVVEEISPHTHPDQVIADITSIKVSPVKTMHKYIKKGVILGTHPVFGPGAKDIAKKSFVLTPTTEEEKALAQKVKDYLETREARVTLMTPQEHDEMMTIILGLSHFIAIVTADTLLSFDRLNQMEAIGGSTYKVLLTLAKSIISEDPEFYASLQMSLPNMVETEELFQRRLKIWADLVRNKNQQEFAQRMNTLRTRLEEIDPDFKKAYENLHRIVEGL